MYTVKQLARLAGITPRTLHHYDAIGLLRPVRDPHNGYRYYDEGAVLLLQQIMFFRELDVPLEKIRGIIHAPGFDVIQALEGHQAQIRQRVQRLDRLLITLNDTLDKLKGNIPMSNKKLFSGFTPEEEEKYSAEAEQMYDRETVRASQKKWKSYTAEQKKAVLDEGNQIYMEMIAAMPLGAGSAEVQALVGRWRAHMDYFWTPGLDQLVGLANLYSQDERFKANFDQMHPQLAEFMLEAVTVYVEKQKSAGR